MGVRLGHLVVALTLSLICFISYSSQIFVIWPWYGGVLSMELLTLLMPFKCALFIILLADAVRQLTCLVSILVAMLLWNYYLCVVTDPGRVPSSWVRFISHISRQSGLLFPIDRIQISSQGTGMK